MIFRHFDEAVLTAQFNVLYDSGIFNSMCRLDTFWIIMSKLELLEPRYEPPVFDTFPDVAMHRNCRDVLMEMGLPAEEATRISGNVNGSIDSAMVILGWTD